MPRNPGDCRSGCARSYQSRRTWHSPRCHYRDVESRLHNGRNDAAAGRDMARPQGRRDGRFDRIPPGRSRKIRHAGGGRR